jgi:hypothetical protein
MIVRLEGGNISDNIVYAISGRNKHPRDLYDRWIKKGKESSSYVFAAIDV